ncbi:uncharacterized protein PRCAT00004953001 [Priceomyces carsonii]|uniref:uncharacterized protein n=1 Tax=Priceomyces carsonii TaxID=28549 RepID=UPI002ED8B64B|nr:unnamed protein product [Priceomyces carsonii]
MMSILPKGPGYLPHWLLFISVVSIFNSIQTYLSKDLKLTQKVYNNTNEVTPLSARTFGTWTILSSILRFYGAYYLANQQVYELVLWTFFIAGVHFISEWLWYGTAKIGSGLLGPLIVSSVSITWMVSQRDFYI